MTVQDIVDATGGTLIQGDPGQIVEDISVDSRSGLSRNGLFVAVAGEKTDGHRYIAGAKASGAVAVLVSEDIEPVPDLAWIQVPDTTEGLQAIGRFCRSRIRIPVVAVTGSVGKTTTREMTALALSARYRTFKTKKNFNSQLGVPIMISQIGPEAEAAVLEAGMSEFGEMARIAPIIRPDITVFTNIGVTHIENLGSRENIFREKFELARAMNPGGTLIVNGDNDILGNLDESCGYRVIRYGLGENCQVRGEDIRREDGDNVFTADCHGKKITVRLAVAGEHMVMNALAALAAAWELGVDPEAAVEKLGVYGGYEGRQKTENIGGVTVIADYYNASPDSMKAALGVMESLDVAGKRVAVLANMNELGPDTRKFHREVGRAAAERGVDLLITVGDLAREIAEGAGESPRNMEIYSCDTRKEAFGILKEKLGEGDILLLKGSNSMKLGEIREDWLRFAESRNAGE
jgi:UDP-N-acetylmuramoyl-tripeptide--D-alanyl-D-alanine ligase